MTIIKYANSVITPQSIVSGMEAVSNKEMESRFKKFAQDLKKIAPKANDFLYFQTIMMHAAEYSLIDEKTGELKKDASGSPIAGGFDENWRWKCTDSNILPYRNGNGDIFSESALLEKDETGIEAHARWCGRPLARDHKSDSVQDIIGIVVDTYYDPKFKRVYALCALDKKNFPKLARDVETGIANSVSMGTAVGCSVCFDCGNQATTEHEYCDCVKQKRAYGEINVALAPLELSLVVSPADPLARIKKVIASMNNYTDMKQEELSKNSSVCITPAELNEAKAQIDMLWKELSLLKQATSCGHTITESCEKCEPSDELDDDELNNNDRSRAMHSGETNTGYSTLDPEQTQWANNLQPSTLDEAQKEQPVARFSAMRSTNDVELVSKELTGLYHKIASLTKESTKRVGNLKEEKKMNKTSDEMLKERALARRAYWQGGGDENEPTPGSTKYPPEDYTSVRDKEDKQMVGDPLETGADGLMKDDESLKEQLHRAELDNRKLRRALLLKEATGEMAINKETGSPEAVKDNTGKWKKVEVAADDGAKRYEEALEEFDLNDMYFDDDGLLEQLAEIESDAIVRLAKKGKKPSKPKKDKYPKKPGKDASDKELKAYEKACKKVDKKHEKEMKAYDKALDKMKKEKSKKKAQDTKRMLERKAYWLGGGDENEPTPGQTKYPSEDYVSYRDRLDKQMVGQGMEPGSEGLAGDDERVKESLHRAKLTARFTKVASHDGEADKESSYWTLLADGKELFKATGEEVFEAKVDDEWDYFSSKDYGSNMIHASYAHGVPAVSIAMKGFDVTAQELPAMPPAPEGMDAPPAPEGLDAPPADEMGDMPDMPEEDDGLGRKASDIADKIQDLALELKEAAGAEDAKGDVMEEASEDKPDLEGAMELGGGAPEAPAEAMQLAASLKEHMKEVYADLVQLSKKFGEKGKVIKQASVSEFDSLIALANDIIEEAEYTLDVKKRLDDYIYSQPTTRDNIDTMAKGLGLFDAESFEVNSDELVTANKKVAGANCAEDECDGTSSCECKKCSEHCACDGATKTSALSKEQAKRAAWRKRIAQTLEGPISDKLKEAHPGGGHTLEGLSTSVSNDMDHVEDLEEAQSKIWPTALSKPTGKQGAVDKDGKLVAEGQDEGKSSYSETGTEYWSQFWGEAGEGQFGNDMGKKFAGKMKEFVNKFAENKQEEALKVDRLKVRRCYVLANDMANKGLIERTQEACDRQVDVLLDLDDKGFDSLKQSVQNMNTVSVKTASSMPALSVGIKTDTEDSESRKSLDLGDLWN